MPTRSWLGAAVLAWCSISACARPDHHDAPPLRVTPVQVQACGPRSPESLMGCVDGEAWMRDVRFIARPRASGSATWQQMQELCATRLADLGFEVVRNTYESGVNVIGTLHGPDPSVLVLAAHYDSPRDCASADDGASGLAALLETARVLVSSSFEKTLVVACFDEGARSRNGSMVEAVSTFVRGTPVLGAIAFGSVGYASSVPGMQRLPRGIALFLPELARMVASRDYRADFLNVVGNESSYELRAAFADHAPATLPLGLVEAPSSLRRRPEFSVLQRADHAGFWMQGYPAVLLTDTAEFRNPNHHCNRGNDSPDTLSVPFAKSVIQTTVGASASLLTIARQSVSMR